MDQGLTQHVTKNNLHWVTPPAMHLADAVFQCGAVIAAAALNGAEIGCEKNHIALLRGKDDVFRLHAQYLLGQHEFSARVIVSGPAEGTGACIGKETSPYKS